MRNVVLASVSQHTGPVFNKSLSMYLFFSLSTSLPIWNVQFPSINVSLCNGSVTYTHPGGRGPIPDSSASGKVSQHILSSSNVYIREVKAWVEDHAMLPQVFKSSKTKH